MQYQVPDMIRDDPQYVFETFRMTPETFQELLAMVGPSLKKQNSVREAISPSERLLMTLAYLVSGDQQKSIAKNYSVGRATVCLIVRKACKSIFDTLKPLYLTPPTKQDFRRIAAEFENMWQFPNCVGAIDGKHFAIPAPPNSGSLYHNYKKYFSVVLLAACDANYNFTLINNGACGSESDGGIFRRSEFGKRVFNGTLQLPPGRKLVGTENICPHVFVSDEAFQLLQDMMRPFPGDNLSIEKRIFNYLLSRARRVIENTFGILVARWQLLRDTIHMLPDHAICAINACIVLHNFVRRNIETRRLYCPIGFVDYDDPLTGLVINGVWRAQVTTRSRLQQLGSNNYQIHASDVRQTFLEYFSVLVQFPGNTSGL